MTATRGSTREAFMAYVPLTTRWMDNDVYGHLNNVVYYSFFDTAVNQTLIGAGLLDIERSPVIALVVETGCRYFASVSFPSTIDIGLRVAKIGTSSVRYELGLFAQNHDTAAAEGHFVHVYVDRETRRPCSIPVKARRLFETLQAQA